jgi:hypothetical protein
MILTDIPISAVVLAWHLTFGLCDDVREFRCGTPHSILVAGRLSEPI